MAARKRKHVTKEERKRISERMKQYHAERRERAAIAAGAGTERARATVDIDPNEVRTSPVILSVDKDGIVKVLMPADVWLSYDNNTIRTVVYKIGDITVSVQKG